MWTQRNKLKLLEEELESINLFERLYETHNESSEADQQVHAVRQIRKTAVLAEIERMQGPRRGRRPL